MILPRPLKKFVGILRGDVSPGLILLSVLLGFWFGLMPGWTGVHAVLLVAALVLNVHFGIFLLVAGIGKALCYAAAPIWYYVGTAVLPPLEPLFGLLGSLPIIGLTDFARYAVAGTFVVGPVVGFVAGLLLAQSVTRFRKAWLSLEEGSEAFRKWQSRAWVRWLDWLLLGKRTKDVRATLEKKTSVIRVPGVIAAVVLLAIAGAGAYFVQGDRLGSYVTAGLSQANGAEVNVGTFDLALLAGRVHAEEIQLTDPAKPTHNRLAANELTADADLWNILRGRLVIDEVTVGGVTFDQQRQAPGAVIDKPEEPAAVEAAAEEKWRAALPDIAQADVAKLESYVARSEQVEQMLRSVQDWLPAREDAAPPPKPGVPEHYLGYLTARVATPPAPSIVVRKVVLGDVQFPWEYIGRAKVTCENLSDAPAAAGLPLTILIESHDRPTRLELVRRFDAPDSPLRVAGRIDDVDLNQLQQSLSNDNPVVFEGGTASTEIDGTASRAMIDLTLKVQTKNMQARTSGGGLFGLDPKVASEAMRVLEQIDTTLRVAGPTTAPRVAFDGEALAGEFRNALVEAGKTELVNRLEEELGDKVPGGVPKADDITKDPLGAGKKALGGFLGGDKKDGKKEDGQ